jgi:transposase-like protein
MPRKRHTPEEIVAKLRQVDVPVSRGRGVAEAARSIGTTEVTYHRWREEYGGPKSDQVKRMEALEAENARPRRAIADLTLDEPILEEAASGNSRAPRAAGPASTTSAPSRGSPSAGCAACSARTARRGARRRGGGRTRSG